MGLYVVQQLVLLILGLVQCLLSKLILMSQVVNVALQSVDLLDARLLSLLDLS